MLVQRLAPFQFKVLLCFIILVNIDISLFFFILNQYEQEASKYWNAFCKTYKNNFFKNRNWLFLEFPEILPQGKRIEWKQREKIKIMSA